VCVCDIFSLERSVATRRRTDRAAMTLQHFERDVRKISPSTCAVVARRRTRHAAATARQRENVTRASKLCRLKSWNRVGTRRVQRRATTTRASKSKYCMRAQVKSPRIVGTELLHDEPGISPSPHDKSNKKTLQRVCPSYTAPNVGASSRHDESCLEHLRIHDESGASLSSHTQKRKCCTHAQVIRQKFRKRVAAQQVRHFATTTRVKERNCYRRLRYVVRYRKRVCGVTTSAISGRHHVRQKENVVCAPDYASKMSA
jgi:hypothetical protein